MEIKCDLVLLSWNNLPILKQCVESIIRCTHTPSRLIIIDNGSTQEGVGEYISSLEPTTMIQIERIMNPVNEGFARGMNKGLLFSSAPYACILNNDIIVTDGWLEEMIRVAEDGREIGIVNPSSNNFGLRFGRDTTLEEFASSFRDRSGRWVEMNACIGFCMLVKRELIAKIGGLDEEYGYAYFEDTDYSRRAQAAGYKCAMAKGCYVYHMEGRSGKLLGDKDKFFRRSAEIFFKRWGKPLRVAYVLAEGDEDYFEEIRLSVEAELKARNRVWIFAPRGLRIGGLPENLDLMRETLAKNLFYLAAFWNIIKKKKRFDRIYVDGRALRLMLVIYRLLRGAEIIGYGFAVSGMRRKPKTANRKPSLHGK